MHAAEIWVNGHSRSLNMTRFDRCYTTSHQSTTARGFSLALGYETGTDVPLRTYSLYSMKIGLRKLQCVGYLTVTSARYYGYNF